MPAASRFEIRVGDELAGFVTYRRHPDYIVFVHTEIFDKWEGHGLGSKLAAWPSTGRAAEGLHVVPRLSVHRGLHQGPRRVRRSRPIVTVLHRLRARNIATASNNKIHDDTVARQYGFEGGLVPGVEVYAYATHPVVARFGVDWLERGTADVRLHKPVYDGREVTVEADTDAAADSCELALVVRDDSGTDCATATVRLGSDNPPDARDFPEAPLPDPVPRDRGRLERCGTPRARSRRSSTRTAPTNTSKRSARRCPSTASSASRIRRGCCGAPIGSSRPTFVSVRGSTSKATRRTSVWCTTARPCRRVAGSCAVREQREHKFVTIDVGMFAGSDIRPVVRVTHTAIYEPRSR